MIFKKIAIVTALVFASTTSAHASLLGWLFGGFNNGGGSGGSDPFCVPEIDALSGMAASAVLIGLVMIAREKFSRK